MCVCVVYMWCVCVCVCVCVCACACVGDRRAKGGMEDERRVSETCIPCSVCKVVQNDVIIAPSMCPEAEM